jgi:hypothetical protein
VFTLNQGLPRTYVVCQDRIMRAADANVGTAAYTHAVHPGAVDPQILTEGTFCRKPEPCCMPSASSINMVFPRAARDAKS